MQVGIARLVWYHTGRGVIGLELAKLQLRDQVDAQNRTPTCISHTADVGRSWTSSVAPRQLEPETLAPV